MQQKAHTTFAVVRGVKCFVSGFREKTGAENETIGDTHK